MNFQDAPARLGLNSRRDERDFGDDGKLIAGPCDAKEWTLRCPGRNGRTGREPGNSKAFGQQTELETTDRGGHGELEEAPDKTIVYGLEERGRGERAQSFPVALLNTWRDFLCGTDCAP